QFPTEEDVRRRRQVVAERGLLADQFDAGGAGFRGRAVGRIASAETDAAAARQKVAAGDPEERRLARTVLAHEDDDFARRDRKRNVGERGHSPEIPADCDQFKDHARDIPSSVAPRYDDPNIVARVSKRWLTGRSANEASACVCPAGVLVRFATGGGLRCCLKISRALALLVRRFCRRPVARRSRRNDAAGVPPSHHVSRLCGPALPRKEKGGAIFGASSFQHSGDAGLLLWA